MSAAASLLVLAGALAATPPAGATLIVRVDGIAARSGEVLVAVCDRGFDREGCAIGQRRAPEGEVEEFRFAVPPGRYAVAVFHDVNGNGELDRVPPGLPTEPYGFSNDVGRWSVPRFDGALVTVGPGETVVPVSLGRFLGLG